ncbi:MAG TPA: tetratricopeptide repeat protein, partial [Planctomycetota bacterium]|nr:tetratricopeptide repeat protein [Planctomycetota bacterium]
FDVRLDLSACEGDGEVVVNVIDYNEWRPEGRGSETEDGNQLVVEASLQGSGGCSTTLKAKRFIFELSDVSSEPGVCMNFPRSGGSGKPDLAFMTQYNVGEWLNFSDFALKLTTKDGSYTESPRAYISSFDWGGYATLKVTAEFEDHDPVVGYLAEDSSVKDIPIPKRKPSSHIADAWLAQQGAGDLDDTDDSESEPQGDGHKGDGLFLYEEYRGFYEGSGRDHADGKPKKKDLFVVDASGSAAGINLFRAVTGLEVHGELEPEQVDEDRVVNFNRSSRVGNTNDQHALYLERTTLDDLLGNAVGGPGLPVYVRRVLLNTSFTPRTINALVGGNRVAVTQEAFVTAHEMLHGCNVFHHGDLDRRVTLTVQESDGALWYSFSGPGGSALVPLYTETCGAVTPIRPRSASDPPLRIYLAFKGGQHSGAESCILRYNLATYYIGADEQSIWHHGDQEPPGFNLCTKPQGSSFNASGHCPEPRYGGASVGCCKDRICVNDSQDHTPMVPPGPCGGGGGGRGGGGGGGGGGGEEIESGEIAGAGSGGGAPADDRPRLALAANESRVASAIHGWPLLITLQVTHPAFPADEGAAPDIVLASPGGPWTSAVQFRLTQGGATVAMWPRTPLGNPPGSLNLAPDEVAAVGWWVSPNDTAGIPPGEYLLEAELDTTAAPVGWHGVAKAAPVRVTVASEPVPLGPALEAEKALALARYLTAQGMFAEALTSLDGLLAKQPSHPVALFFRAQVLEITGDDAGALSSYDEALDAFEAAHPDAAEFPFELIASQEEVQTRVLLGGSGDEPRFRRGDVNADGILNIGDPITTLGYLYLGTPSALVCAKAADADDSGTLILTDAIYLLSYLFLGGGPPVAPFPGCGLDNTADNLGCTPRALCQ